MLIMRRLKPGNRKNSLWVNITVQAKVSKTILIVIQRKMKHHTTHLAISTFDHKTDPENKHR